MKNLKRLSLLSTLCVLEFFAVNAMEGKSEEEFGFEEIKNPETGHLPEQPGTTVVKVGTSFLNLINEFNSYALALGNEISKKGLQNQSVVKNLKEKLKESIAVINTLSYFGKFTIFNKLSPEYYNFRPIQLAKFYADKYKREAWSKLSLTEKAKWAGLFYWDEVTVLWDKFIKDLQKIESDVSKDVAKSRR